MDALNVQRLWVFVFATNVLQVFFVCGKKSIKKENVQS